MKTKPESPLEALIAKFESAEAELRDVKAAEPTLRADVDSLLTELHGLDSRFLIVRPEPGALDTATEVKLQKLQMARGKLEVLPGIVSKCETRVSEIAAEISSIVQAGIDDIRHELRERLEELRKELNPKLSKICGGDHTRTQAAINAVVDNSELNRWRTKLPATASNYGNFAVERAQRFLKVQAGWEAGKTLTEAWG